MHDGFVSVKRKRKRKQKSLLEYQLSSCEPKTFLKDKINLAIKEFELSQVCFDILQEIHSCLQSSKQNSINEILSYGIGRISESKSSLHQLAALLVFQKKFNSAVKVYDPVFSKTEIEFLSEFDIKVLENEEGKRKLVRDSVTIVFLPHCPRQLINNFLWTNWNTSLRNCILIGNSFTKIVEDNTKKILQESAKYIFKIQPKTQETPLNNTYHLDNIFNDISIHHFNSENLTKEFFIETLEEEPVYADSTEFVTKKLNSINIKNE